MSITDALSGLLNRYVEMVNSGDCGFWNPEKDAEVIAARAALGTIADIAQVEAAVIKTIEDIPAHGGGAMELYPATLRQKLSPEMIRTIARAALAAAHNAGFSPNWYEAGLEEGAKTGFANGLDNGFAAGIEAAAKAARAYPYEGKHETTPALLMSIEAAILALRPPATPDPAGAPSEEDVERMICEWWGRTGRGILETSAINDLTRAVLALLRQDNK